MVRFYTVANEKLVLRKKSADNDIIYHSVVFVYLVLSFVHEVTLGCAKDHIQPAQKILRDVV